MRNYFRYIISHTTTMVKKQHNNINIGSDEEDQDNGQFNRDYRKFLYSQFPSKFLEGKIREDEEESRKHKHQARAIDTDGITTRSGKVIRRITPTQVAQITQIPAARLSSKPAGAGDNKTKNTTTNSGVSKSLKNASSPVIEKQSSSKHSVVEKAGKTQSKLHGRGMGGGIDDKKKTRRFIVNDPPSSSDTTSDEDGDHETATTTDEGELADESGSGTISRKKQAAAHLKKLLSKNDRIMFYVLNRKVYVIQIFFYVLKSDSH